jgi:HPr kinase/phosphorylase
MAKEQLHATCIALNGKGVLLRGASGSGKSDFALRLINQGAVLVADDRVDIECQEGQLVAYVPENLAGKLEVRGIGIVNLPHERDCPLVIVVDLVPPEQVERMPEAATTDILGHPLPLWRIAPFEVSAVNKLFLALGITTGDIVCEQ